MNRKDYDCKDGFLYALIQTKECGKCRGYNSPWNSRKVEHCIYVNQCKFYQAYRKDTIREFHDYMNDIPVKWFRKCTLYRVKEGGEE